MFKKVCCFQYGHVGYLGNIVAVYFYGQHFRFQSFAFTYHAFVFGHVVFDIFPHPVGSTFPITAFQIRHYPFMFAGMGFHLAKQIYIFKVELFIGRTVQHQFSVCFRHFTPWLIEVNTVFIGQCPQKFRIIIADTPFAPWSDSTAIYRQGIIRDYQT